MLERKEVLLVQFDGAVEMRGERPIVGRNATRALEERLLPGESRARQGFETRERFLRLERFSEARIDLDQVRQRRDIELAVLRVRQPRSNTLEVSCRGVELPWAREDWRDLPFVITTEPAKEQAIRDATTHEAGVLEYQAHFLSGEIHEALGSPESAYQSYCIARDRLETIRSVLWGDDLKIAFMKTKLAVYERLVDLCLARNGDQAAGEIFEYIEQAKSRSLRDLFADRGSLTGPEDPNQSELVRQIRTLREELNWYYHRVELEQLSRDERSAARLDHLQEQLRTREHAFIRVLREIPQASRELVGPVA